MVSKPEINANGVVLTPAIARQLAAQIILNSSGYEKPEGVAKMNPLQTYAWEMCGIPIQFFGIEDEAHALWQSMSEEFKRANPWGSHDAN